MADDTNNQESLQPLERRYYELDKKVALIEASQSQMATDFGKNTTALEKIASSMTKIVTRQEFKEYQNAQAKLIGEMKREHDNDITNLISKRIVPLETAQKATDTALTKQVNDTSFLVKLKTAIGEKAFNALVTAVYGILAFALYLVISGKSLADFLPGGPS